MRRRILLTDYAMRPSLIERHPSSTLTLPSFLLTHETCNLRAARNFTLNIQHAVTVREFFFNPRNCIEAAHRSARFDARRLFFINVSKCNGTIDSRKNNVSLHLEKSPSIFPIGSVIISFVIHIRCAHMHLFRVAETLNNLTLWAAAI